VDCGEVVRWRARRWHNLDAFRVLFGGGAIPTMLVSWTEMQSTMEGNRGRNRDGGRRWRRENAAFAREKMNSDGPRFCKHPRHKVL